MPYKSLKQERFMHSAAKRGDIKQSVVDEFDAASKGKKLPERVSKTKKPAVPTLPKHKDLFGGWNF